MAASKPRVRLPDQAQTGEIIEVKALITHVMETGNRKDKVVPKREWIEGVVEQAKALGKPVFMKDSMKPIWGDDIITEFPWSE